MSKGSINLGLIAEIQRILIELLEIEDDDYVDGRTRRGKEKAIDNRLSKITLCKVEQIDIYRIIEKHNFNYKDSTFKPICDDLRMLGYEILEGNK